MALLHTHRYGPEAAPVLLALHGVTGHGARFRRLAEEGLPDFRVVAVDLRGHGRSPWVPPWNAEQHVDDLVETMDHLGLDDVAILGHSFGGMLATHLVARVPSRFSRLVLLDPVIRLKPEEALGAAQEACQDAGWPTRAAALEAKRAQRPAHAVFAADEEVAEHLVAVDGRFRMRYAAPAAAAAWGEMARDRVPVPRGMPTLLAYATEADYVGQDLIDGLRADLGDGLVVRPIAAGHLLYWDAQAETTAVVRAFLGG